MKKNHLSLLSLLLALVTLLTAFSGCGKAGDGEGTTEAPTEEQTTPPPAEVILASNGTTQYTVVRSENADDTEKSAAVKVRSTITDVTGASIGIQDDWYNARNGETLPEKNFEILVGATNRVEAVAIALRKHLLDN